MTAQLTNTQPNNLSKSPRIDSDWPWSGHTSTTKAIIVEVCLITRPGSPAEPLSGYVRSVLLELFRSKVRRGYSLKKYSPKERGSDANKNKTKTRAGNFRNTGEKVLPFFVRGNGLGTIT